MPNFNIKPKYMSVSMDFIENLMPEANPTFVKVYLYALMLSSKGDMAESGVIAKKLGLLESDVILAMKYWEEKGLLGEEPKKLSLEQKPLKPHSEEIAEDAFNNEELKQMLRISQEVLGKTLSSADTKTLYWIYDNLKLPIEVILVLLEYCVSINKRSMNYIEQVALSWSERGITTLEEADRFMREQAEKGNSYASLKRIFGINSRDFTTIELNYLNTWTSVYNMSEEMIALAYEYCILRTNKLSFPYMDKIIENWFGLGIHTIADAEADNEKFKNNNTKASSDFDLLKNDDTAEEFEKIMWEKMKNGN